MRRHPGEPPVPKPEELELRAALAEQRRAIAGGADVHRAADEVIARGIAQRHWFEQAVMPRPEPRRPHPEAEGRP